MSNANTAETPSSDREEESLDRERAELLGRLEEGLEIPMLVLAFGWLALLVVELVWGESRLFEITGTIIWVIFIAELVLKLVLAPHKGAYLKRNWLTAISLLVPALRLFRVARVFRILRLARAARGLRLLRIISSLNRSMRALGANLSRRGFGYVAGLTVVVTFAGAAGMYAFERGGRDGIDSYGEALWWTAMIMTTMGSQVWPVTLEGRVLCVFLALYAFGVFGYVTATLATFFVGRDAAHDEAELAGAGQLADLRAEVHALRDDIRALSSRRTPDPPA
ncbi:MAG: ion transporter [Myxococcota bacterium]|nr:ion transporter [Deltaproteobacteria bacterium]MDQ3338329.1 ion transporter [Myxococcota bacterium]